MKDVGRFNCDFSKRIYSLIRCSPTINFPSALEGLLLIESDKGKANGSSNYTCINLVLQFQCHLGENQKGLICSNPVLH